MKSELAALITEALEKLVVDGALSEIPELAPQIDRPRDPSNGDLSCNIAMVLSKRAGMAPRDIATLLITALPSNNLVDRCDIAGPGFINFFVNQSQQTGIVRTIIEAGDRYGVPKQEQVWVQVEFVSANPTGPLHVGHGRGPQLATHWVDC